MCNFVSWIEYEGHVYFIDNNKLLTKEGQKLLLPDAYDDRCGHGAITSYYPELKGKGVHKECEDFSTPDNFPKEIVDAIKKGQLSNIGIAIGLLNDKGAALWEAKLKPLYADYWAKRKPLYADYEAKLKPLYADYWAKRKPLYADYEAKRNALYADYEAKRNALYADYDAKRAQTFWKIFSCKKYKNKNWL